MVAVLFYFVLVLIGWSVLPRLSLYSTFKIVKFINLITEVILVIFYTYFHFFFFPLGPQSAEYQQILLLSVSSSVYSFARQGVSFPLPGIATLPCHHTILAFSIVRRGNIYAYVLKSSLLCIFVTLFHLSLTLLLIKQRVSIFSILLHIGISHAPNQFEKSD